jgi:hypothetical protein
MGGKPVIIANLIRSEPFWYLVDDCPYVQIILRQIRSQIGKPHTPPGEPGARSVDAAGPTPGIAEYEGSGAAAKASAAASASCSAAPSAAATCRVACLLSGGVDSSVALALLCNQEVSITYIDKFM